MLAMVDNKYMTVQAASREFGVSANTLYRRIRDREIRAWRIGGTIHVLREDIAQEYGIIPLNPEEKEGDMPEK